MNAGPAHWPLEEPRRQSGVRPKNKTPPINDDDASVQENRQGAASERPRGATVARLTPDQKVACSNHVGVKFWRKGAFFHKVAGQFVFDSRNLLKRNLFTEIIEDHLANRSKENVEQLEALSL